MILRKLQLIFRPELKFKKQLNINYTKAMQIARRNVKTETQSPHVLIGLDGPIFFEKECLSTKINQGRRIGYTTALAKLLCVSQNAIIVCKDSHHARVFNDTFLKEYHAMHAYQYSKLDRIILAIRNML
jgi:ribosome-binding factor A